MAAAFSLPYCPRMCSGDWPLIKRVAKVRHLSVTTVTPKKEFSELYDLKSKEYITDKSITNKIKITQNQKLLRCTRGLGRQWARSQGTWSMPGTSHTHLRLKASASTVHSVRRARMLLSRPCMTARWRAGEKILLLCKSRSKQRKLCLLPTLSKCTQWPAKYRAILSYPLPSPPWVISAIL